MCFTYLRRIIPKFKPSVASVYLDDDECAGIGSSRLNFSLSYLPTLHLPSSFYSCSLKRSDVIDICSEQDCSSRTFGRIMHSVSTPSGAWTALHQIIEAQNQQNSTDNSSSLNTTNNYITTNSGKRSNEFQGLFNSVCNVVSTNKTHVVGSNRI